jgi:hypothetical protein
MKKDITVFRDFLLFLHDRLLDGVAFRAVDLVLCDELGEVAAAVQPEDGHGQVDVEAVVDDVQVIVHSGLIFNPVALEKTFSI